MVLDPLAPCVTVRLLGDAERLKSGMAAAITVRLSVAVWVKLPEIPVMVREKVPVAAVLVALSVRTLVLVALVGLNEEAVTPLGRPETDSATLPVKPFCGVTVMVLVPLPPCVRVYGDAERLKFGAGLTVSVKLCVAFGSVPFAAVTVIGKVPLTVGVPLSTPAVLNVTPPGSAPVSVSVG